MNGLELAELALEHAQDQLRAQHKRDQRLERIAWENTMMTNIRLLEYHRERMTVGTGAWIRANAVIEQFEGRLGPSLAEVG
jgi:hypothetical protein